MKKLTTPHEAELDEMREIFSLVDKDGGGTISNEELSELFSIVGIEASDEDLDEMIRQMDEDNSGEIDFEADLFLPRKEFASVMLRRVDPGFTSSEIRDAFQVVQCNSGSEKGRVHVNDVVTFLMSYGSDFSKESFTEEKVVELVQQMNCDGKGYIAYEAFIEMMMNR
eukprot:scaffold5936_cov268-Chaetoceros_neogracile.AAC.21